MLDVDQHRSDLRVVHEVDAHADRRIELVDGTHEADALFGLRNAGVVGERGRAVVAGAGHDAVQADGHGGQLQRHGDRCGTGTLGPANVFVQPLLEVLQLVDSASDVFELPTGNDCGGAVRLVEQLGDVLEREAERAERDDALEAVDLDRSVAAVTARRSMGRFEQSDVVVVVQGANGDA